MSETVATRARGLTERYKQVAAVNSLDLGVPRGAENTTTVRILLGLVRPPSGRAEVLGHDIARARRAIAPTVCAIVESPAWSIARGSSPPVTRYSTSCGSGRGA